MDLQGIDAVEARAVDLGFRGGDVGQLLADLGDVIADWRRQGETIAAQGAEVERLRALIEEALGYVRDVDASARIRAAMRGASS